MDLLELGKKLASAGLHLLGAALPIPGGAAIATGLAAALGLSDDQPVNIAAAMQDPAKLQAAMEFQAKHEERLLELTSSYEIEMRKADSADVAIINQTIQKELEFSASEDRVQKWWRPANGYVVALGSLLSVIGVLVLFYVAITDPKLGLNVPTVINTIPTLASAIAMILAVPGAAVGITAWHRGVKQRLEVEATQNASTKGGDPSGR